MHSLSCRLLRGLPLLLALWLAACASPPAAPPVAAPAPADAGLRDYPYASGVLTVDTRQGTCRLTVRGALDAAAVRAIGPALQQLGTAACAVRTASLQSTSGVIGDAITLGAMLRNRGYHTELPAGQVCDSPCVLAFAAGAARVVHTGPPAAQIRFTQIPPDLDFGRQTCATELSRGQQLTLARYLRAMLPDTTANAVYQQWLQADCRTSGSASPAQALAMGLATALR
jgi:hypothetical protein